MLSKHKQQMSILARNADDEVLNDSPQGTFYKGC